MVKIEIDMDKSKLTYETKDPNLEEMYRASPERFEFYLSKFLHMAQGTIFGPVNPQYDREMNDLFNQFAREALTVLSKYSKMPKLD